MATVTDLALADQLIERLCGHGYVTSAEFNRTLGDRRWLMRHANGQRTHHLHLVLEGSKHWLDAIAFRDALRADPSAREAYAALKVRLAANHGDDRDAYTAAKSDFVTAVLSGVRRT